MDKILRALMALQKACEEHGTPMRWDNVDGLDGRFVKGMGLVAEVELSPEDFDFIESARKMFAPA